MRFIDHWLIKTWWSGILIITAHPYQSTVEMEVDLVGWRPCRSSQDWWGKDGILKQSASNSTGRGQRGKPKWLSRGRLFWHALGITGRLWHRDLRSPCGVSGPDLSWTTDCQLGRRDLTACLFTAGSLATNLLCNRSLLALAANIYLQGRHHLPVGVYERLRMWYPC